MRTKGLRGPRVRQVDVLEPEHQHRVRPCAPFVICLLQPHMQLARDCTLGPCIRNEQQLWLATSLVTRLQELCAGTCVRSQL